MEFATQEELLEHLGKNVNDRRLVQRMVLRWEVVRENGVYRLVDKDEEIKNLMERIFFLENERSKNTTNDLEKQLGEAKTQWDYWETKCRKYWKYIENVIEVTYNRVKPHLWNKLEGFSEFREHILEEVKEICWRDDE